MRFDYVPDWYVFGPSRGTPTPTSCGRGRQRRHSGVPVPGGAGIDNLRDVVVGEPQCSYDAMTSKRAVADTVDEPILGVASDEFADLGDAVRVRGCRALCDRPRVHSVTCFSLAGRLGPSTTKGGYEVRSQILANPPDGGPG